MIELTNEYLTVTIDPLGAELTSVIDRKTNYEFMWQKDPAYWNRTSPILFPIVGRLKDNAYNYNQKNYLMHRHGFARDMEFNVQTQTENSVSLFLKSNGQTLTMYPFEFSLQVTYILYERQVTVSYEVLNPSDQTMYYSIGGHPAFNVSQTQTADKNLELDQIYFELTPGTSYLRIPLTQEGLSKPNSAKFESSKRFQLSYDQFIDDAIVYRIAQRTRAILTDESKGIEIEMDLNQMPYLGVWTPYGKNAPFVSLEPWAGISDSIDSEGQFIDKAGIQTLEPNRLNTHDYAMTFKTL